MKILNFLIFVFSIFAFHSFANENSGKGCLERHRKAFYGSFEFLLPDDCFKNLSECTPQSPFNVLLDKLVDTPKNLMRFSQINKFNNEYVKNRLINVQLKKKILADEELISIDSKEISLWKSYEMHYANKIMAQELLKYIDEAKIQLESDQERMNLRALIVTLPNLEKIINDITDFKKLIQWPTVNHSTNSPFLRQLRNLFMTPTVVESIDKHLREIRGSTPSMVEICLNVLLPEMTKYGQQTKPMISDSKPLTNPDLKTLPWYKTFSLFRH